MALKDYKADPAQNTTISGIDIGEGCAPSGINNAIRQLMADINEGLGGGLKIVTKAQFSDLGDSQATDKVIYFITA
jgi:hypothetical protein